MTRVLSGALAAFLLIGAVSVLFRAIDGSGRPLRAAHAIVDIVFLIGGTVLLRRAVRSIEPDESRLWRGFAITWAINAAGLVAYKVGMALLVRRFGESAFNGLFILPLQGVFIFSLFGLYGYGLYAAARAPRREWLFVACAVGATAAMYWLSVRVWF